MPPPSTLPFGMPVNGFHPQMSALPNPVGPMTMTIPPILPRRKAGSSSPSSGQQVAMGQVSLSGLIDSRTSTLVNQLRDDVRNEENHRRRLLKKRRRAGYGSSSSYSSSSSSFSESDTSSRSAASSRSASSSSASKTSSSSSASTRRGRDKRQRTSYYYKKMPESGSFVAGGGGKKTFGAAAQHPASYSAFPAAAGSETAVDAPSFKSFPSAAPTTVEPCYDSTSPLSSSGSDTDQASTKASSSAEEYCSNNDGEGFSDLYSEVFLESDRPQLIATLGGRIVTWNEEFLSSTGLLVSQLKGCVTVHNLVEQSMQSRLNELFELALREGGAAGGGGTTAKGAGGGSGGGGAAADLAARPPLTVIAMAAHGRGRGGVAGRMELRQVPAPNGGTDVAKMTPALDAPPLTPGGDDGRSGRSPGRMGGLGAPGSARAAAANFGDVAGGSSVAAAASAATCANDSNGNIEDEDGETHLSITLPCRRFRYATEQLCLTIILMNDIDPSKRCFYCILTPPPTPPPTISVPAPSLPPTLPESHASNGDYKSISNGWYHSLHTGPPADFGALPSSFGVLTQMQTPPPPPTPFLGKIRRIGQKQLASLL